MCVQSNEKPHEYHDSNVSRFTGITMIFWKPVLCRLCSEKSFLRTKMFHVKQRNKCSIVSRETFSLFFSKLLFLVVDFRYNKLYVNLGGEYFGEGSGYHESEGRRREDYYGGESGRLPRRAWAARAPGGF